MTQSIEPPPRLPRGVRKHEVRSRSIALRNITLKVLNEGREEFPPGEYQKPRTRAECERGPRPCLFVSCKYNLYLDVSEIGSIKFNFPDLEPDQMEHSCVLDIADAGGFTLEKTGDALNMTKERVRQLELTGLQTLTNRVKELAK